MTAELKRLELDPDPAEESFDVTVCTAEWLPRQCRDVGGIDNARQHLVVDFE